MLFCMNVILRIVMIFYMTRYTITDAFCLPKPNQSQNTQRKTLERKRGYLFALVYYYETPLTSGKIDASFVYFKASKV